MMYRMIFGLPQISKKVPDQSVRNFLADVRAGAKVCVDKNVLFMYHVDVSPLEQNRRREKIVQGIACRPEGRLCVKSCR